MEMQRRFLAGEHGNANFGYLALAALVGLASMVGFEQLGASVDESIGGQTGSDTLASTGRGPLSADRQAAMLPIPVNGYHDQADDNDQAGDDDRNHAGSDLAGYETAGDEAETDLGDSGQAASGLSFGAFAERFETQPFRMLGNGTKFILFGMAAAVAVGLALPIVAAAGTTVLGTVLAVGLGTMALGAAAVAFSNVAQLFYDDVPDWLKTTEKVGTWMAAIGAAVAVGPALMTGSVIGLAPLCVGLGGSLFFSSVTDESYRELAENKELTLFDRITPWDTPHEAALNYERKMKREDRRAGYAQWAPAAVLPFVHAISDGDGAALSEAYENWADEAEGKSKSELMAMAADLVDAFKAMDYDIRDLNATGREFSKAIEADLKAGENIRPALALYAAAREDPALGTTSAITHDFHSAGHFLTRSTESIERDLQKTDKPREVAKNFHEAMAEFEVEADPRGHRQYLQRTDKMLVERYIEAKRDWKDNLFSWWDTAHEKALAK